MDLIGVLGLGLIFGIFVSGMIVSFRFLGFADLTIEGSFTLGGVIFAVSINQESGILLATGLSIIGGGLAGLLTGILHCYVGINKLLSGITTLTMLYTINLRILGKSNLFIENNTLLNFMEGANYEFYCLIGISTLIYIILYQFFSTNFGLYLRATGENESFIKNIKVNSKVFIIIGLMISNSLIALSGSLFSQYVGYSDIGNGNGMLVSMLTAMIIGENMIRPTTVKRQLFAAFIGAIVFQFLYSLALQFGVNPIDLKIIIGVLLILFFIITKYSNRDKIKKNIGTDFL